MMRRGTLQLISMVTDLAAPEWDEHRLFSVFVPSHLWPHPSFQTLRIDGVDVICDDATIKTVISLHLPEAAMFLGQDYILTRRTPSYRSGDEGWAALDVWDEWFRR